MQALVHDRGVNYIDHTFMVFDESVLTRNGLKLLLYYNDDDGVVWRTFRRAVPGLPVAEGLKSAKVDVLFPGGC